MSAKLLFHTVRHLRWEQFVFRMLSRIRKTRVGSQTPLPSATWQRAWNAPSIKAASLGTDDVWTFLGESHAVTQPEDWNRPEWSKLWLYNLHYFDDLDAPHADTRAPLHRHWIDRWIAENPAPNGNGWEPYPLSLRIVNWVKWLSTRDVVGSAWTDSLQLQVHVLSQRLEYHLLGNHLFANGKALVFAGTFFSGPAATQWLNVGLGILDREIPEQFLPDGGHFELSPMYHTTLLWDLLELIDLAGCTGNDALASRVTEWRAFAERGLAWLAGVSHADGEISFFNDAAFDIAPAPQQLFSYAETLDLHVRSLSQQPVTPLRLTHFADTGYVRLSWENADALLDVARVGPDYLPGHAHADTLSFEWSLGACRVLVNSGTSQYGDDMERQRQRGTAAHNTVVVNEENSSEVWAGFRVARRAYPFGLHIAQAADSITVSCAHDGYRRLPGKPVHRRTWLAQPRKLQVTDVIEGAYRTASARFHLHPHVSANAQGNRVQLTLPDGRSITAAFSGGAPRLVASTWHPRFGESVPSHCIEVALTGSVLQLELTW
nr:alginate lyase family protein [uncultured Ralstonia sp.]